MLFILFYFFRYITYIEMMKLKALHVFLLCLALLCIVVIYMQKFREGLAHEVDPEERKKNKNPEEADDAVSDDDSDSDSDSDADEEMSNMNEPPGQPNNPGSYKPPGVSSAQIPQGDEDLYILKSEMVPPVCPACPTSSACPREKPCQPCPPCARCPEPSFECKKVPNYDSHGAELPKPVLNDFSQFGS
jgi:hypothetical protein